MHVIVTRQFVLHLKQNKEKGKWWVTLEFAHHFFVVDGGK